MTAEPGSPESLQGAESEGKFRRIVGFLREGLEKGEVVKTVALVVAVVLIEIGSFLASAGEGRNDD